MGDPVLLNTRLTTLILVALASSGTILGGYAIKNECTYHGWDNWYQYKHYCYSDILPLYYIRHLDQDHKPYLQEFSEYPVLTGAVTYFAAVMTSGLVAYMQVTFFLLACAGFLTTIALWKTGLTRTQLLGWAASPAILVHAFTNWDLVAVACAAWGWLLWRQERRFWSALLFGLGGAAKLYPAFFLPFLFVAVWIRKDRPGIRDVAVGGFLGFVVPNAFVAALAPHNWLAIWKFHAGRDPDFETPWSELVRWLGPGVDAAEWRTIVSLTAILVLGAASLLFAYRQWRHGLSPLAAGGLFTILFLLVNRVYSPQYTLWVLPILVAMNARPGLVWAYILADAGNFLVRYQLFIPPPGKTDGWDQSWEPWSRALVLVRWFLLLALTVWLMMEHVRPAGASQEPRASASHQVPQP